MLVSNANQYTWKHFSTSPPPPYTPAAQSAQKLLILITD